MARKCTCFVVILLIAITHAATAAERTTVPAQRIKDCWVVRGTVSGRPAFFIIDTGADHTALLPDPLLREGVLGVDIKIGDFEAHANAYVTEQVEALKQLRKIVGQMNGGTLPTVSQPVIGLLSTDVLAGLALGLDKDKAEVTIWPGGKIENKVALGWVGEKESAGAPVRFEIGKVFGDRPGVPIEFGGSKGWAIFDTGAGASSLEPSFSKDFGTLVYKTQIAGLTVTSSEMRIIAGATLASVKIPWLQFNARNTPSTVKATDGTVSPNDIPSRRILIDLAGKALYYMPADRDTALANTLSRMLDAPVAFDGDSLKIGTVSPEFERALKPVENCPIVSIAGHPVKEIVAAFRDKTSASKAYVEEFAVRVRKDFSIIITYKGGNFELKAHPG